MFNDPQSVFAGERLAPVVERQKGRRDLAPFVGHRVAHFERTPAHFGSPHEARSCQVTQRGAQHLLRYTGNLAAELSKTDRAVSDRRENDCAPASAQRRQRDVHAAYVQPVPHELAPSVALTRGLVLPKSFGRTNNRTSTMPIDHVRPAIEKGAIA